MHVCLYMVLRCMDVYVCVYVYPWKYICAHVSVYLYIDMHVLRYYVVFVLFLCVGKGVYTDFKTNLLVYRLHVASTVC